MVVLFPGWQDLLEGNALRLLLLVDRPCGCLGIEGFLFLSCLGGSLRVPWGVCFLCNRNTGVCQMGTIERQLVFRDPLGNNKSIWVCRYTFPGCAHISGTYSSALVVGRRE